VKKFVNTMVRVKSFPKITKAFCFNKESKLIQVSRAESSTTYPVLIRAMSFAKLVHLVHGSGGLA
jgi:hypothetical protein